MGHLARKQTLPFLQSCFFRYFQEKVASGPFLQDKVKECFKDNPHCLTLVMSPDVCTICSAYGTPVATPRVNPFK